MVLVCSISGRIPKEPVVSPEGYVFDAELIREHLRGSDKCPLSGKNLSEFSLQPVNAPPEFIYTRTGTVKRSIPAILKLLRMEFDQKALERLSIESEIVEAELEKAHLNRNQAAAEEVICQLLQAKQFALQKAEDLRQGHQGESKVEFKHHRG